MAQARESNSTSPLKKWLEKPVRLTQVALESERAKILTANLLQNMFPEKMCE